MSEPALPLGRCLIHVNLVVSDIERSVRFYTEILGARIVRRWFGESTTSGRALGLGDGVARWRAYMLRFGDGDDSSYPQIDLLQWIEPPGVGSPPATVNQIGIPRICLATDDVDVAYQRFQQMGVETLSEPRLMNPDTRRGSRVKLVCVRDPDGIVIELVGPLAL